MREMCVLLAGVLAACTTPRPPEQTPPADVAEQSQAPTKAPAASTAGSDAPSTSSAQPAGNAEKEVVLDIVALQAAGYKIVDNDGRKLFCRHESVTGSRLLSKTICLTEQEIWQRRQNALDNLADLSRKAPIPRGN